MWCLNYLLPSSPDSALKCEEDGQVFFSLDDGATKFTDLIHLVEFYQLNRGVLPCKLKHPCTAVALWHSSPQTFLCTPLSLRSPSLPFCPLYPFPYQRSGGWGDGEKLRPVLRMWTTLLGARTGSRCPPVGNVRLHLTAAWLFEWELLGQAKCRRLWTPAVVLLLVFRPQKKTSVMWNHKMATVCFQWVSWMDPFL